MTEADIKAEFARGQAEAVRMLDAWAAAGPPRFWAMSRGNGFWMCEVTMYRKRLFHGDSPEAARANAAEAIRGEL